MHTHPRHHTSHRTRTAVTTHLMTTLAMLTTIASLSTACLDEGAHGRGDTASDPPGDPATGETDDGWGEEDTSGDTADSDAEPPDGPDDPSGDGGTSGDGDEDGPAPFDPDDIVLSRVEVGVPLRGASTEGATGWAMEPDSFGPIAPGSPAWASSSAYRASAHPLAIGEGVGALELDVRDSSGGPVHGVTLTVTLSAFTSSTALPASTVWSTTTSTLAKDGRVRVQLSAEDASALALVDPVWLRVELDEEPLAPLLRWGEVPTVIVAEGVPAGGVEPDVVLPQAALEATTRVARWTVRPGDVLSSIPDPALWSCAWRVRDAAELRVERRDVQLACCDAGDPTGLCSPGPTYVAYAETWVSGGVGVHATGATDCNLASSDCAAVVWARLVPWAETPTLDASCAFVGKPWRAGAPRVITAPGDPSAKDLLLAVDAVCTRR